MTTPPAPRVSVVIPFLDGEQYLAEAIDSVLAQTFTDRELLLVDDGSGPAATAIARRYAEGSDGRICYLDHPGHANRGLSATRNVGLGAARGELIALLDADDVWHPTKLADQVAILDAHPDVGLVCGAVRYWRSWAGGDDAVIPTGHVADRVVHPPEASLALYPLGSAAAPCPSDLLVRRPLALAVGGFEEHFDGERQLYEDQPFLAKVYLRSPVWFSSQVWLDYRQHDRSLMARWASRYAEVRAYFLRWLDGHLAQSPPASTGLTPDQHRAVVRAVHRAQRRNRHPRLRRAVRLPARVPRRLLAAARRP